MATAIEDLCAPPAKKADTFEDIEAMHLRHTERQRRELAAHMSKTESAKKRFVVVVRFRNNRNSFSWGVLVRLLADSGCTVVLLKKTPSAAALRKFDVLGEEACREKALGVMYLDSFMTVDVGLAEKDLGAMRSAVGELGAERLFFYAACGGAHPTALPESVLELGFDSACRGEGEVTVCELLSAVLDAFYAEGPEFARVDHSNVRGLTFRCPEKGVVTTDKPPLVNLDEYIPFCENPRTHPPFEIMRGCNCGCLYCQTPRLIGRVRYRSMRSIEYIIQKYAAIFPPPLDLRIIAPNALAFHSKTGREPNVEALAELLRVAKSYNTRLFLGSFPSEVRPDFVNPQTIEILKQCDSPVVAVGAQAGSESELKRMARGHSVDTALRACEMLLAAGLEPYVDFMLCCPNETPEEQVATANFAKQLLDMGCSIRLHHFMPLPGTPWRDLPPSPLHKEVMPLLNPLLGDPRVEGAFKRQKDDSIVPLSKPI